MNSDGSVCVCSDVSSTEDSDVSLGSLCDNCKVLEEQGQVRVGQQADKADGHESVDQNKGQEPLKKGGESQQAVKTASVDKNQGTSKKYLFCFDFDHTIVEGNSDLVIQQVHHSGPIPERVRIVAKHQGWTTFMQEVFRFHYANHVTKEMFCETLDTIPLVPGVLDSIKAIHETGELVVISDANSFFISHVLERQGVLGYFSEIISNPAKFDEKGQLSITPYHNNTDCKLSSRNLCKGRVLEEYIAKRSQEGTEFSFIAYCGDGINDFCPMLRLSEKDIALPRKDFSIESYIARMAQEQKIVLKVKTIYWKNGQDIINAIQEKLKELNPTQKGN